MDQHTPRFQFKVGLFVFVGLILVCASILILGGNRVVLTRYAHYQIRFKEVQGLFAGSVVSLSGMNVGNIKKLEFAPNDGLIVADVQVDRNYEKLVTQGTVAEIRTQGALGDKYIYLTPGPVTAAQIPPGSELPVSSDPDIIAMLSNKDDGVGRVLDAIKELQILLATMNSTNRMGLMMDNMSGAAAQLRTALNEVTLTMKEVRGQLPEDRKFKQAVTSLASVLEKIDQGKGSLGALINDPSVHQSLKTFLGGSPRRQYLKDVVRESIQQSESK